jgi:SPP1 gp7 family putative phage head morphogenesis protein
MTAFRFDGKNPSAQGFAERMAARYVTRVSEETRQAVNSLIARSFREGISARDTAKLIRSIVGLTSQGAAAVANYNQRLVATGTNPTRAQELSETYADKLLTVRSKTIARTEIMGAMNGGALEQARQRTEEGLYRDPRKKWLITPDEITCPVCRPLQGQVRRLHEAFSIGVQAPPAHPNCRCSISFFDGAIQARPEPVVSPGNWNLQGEERQAYAQQLLDRRKPA